MAGLSLVAVSLVFGLFALWVFGRTTDLAAVRSTIRRLHAYILEFRLYYDEPRLIWQAQKAIVRENVRLLLLTLRPLAILTLPMAWLLIQLDTVYAYAPLPLGQASVITAQLLAAENIHVSVQAPPEISVETLAVHSLIDRQVSWRIRPTGPVQGSLRLILGNITVDKSVAAGTRPVFLVRKRVRSLIDFLLHPEEGRLPAANVAWIEVDYPKTDVRIAGIALPWIAWFLVLSALSALVFARWFGMPS